MVPALFWFTMAAMRSPQWTVKSHPPRSRSPAVGCLGRCNPQTACPAGRHAMRLFLGVSLSVYGKARAIMGKIAALDYFRVPPRWLFVKVTDEHDNVGWGEASLEGHTQAVEGCLSAWFKQYLGLEAE